MSPSNKNDVKKVVLAYSGGLDTSVILRWLQEVYDCEVVTFTADLGQGEELEPARRKAEALGASEIYVEDLREEFVRDYVFPMFRANALYEGVYLLGTSIARPLIAKRQIEIAHLTGADAVAHGATGKGNDQIRFELGYYALDPAIRVIAPWREWELDSRTALLAFAEKHQIPIAGDKRGEAPYSTDANLLHISYEGRALEDPWVAPDEEIYTRSVAPEAAPDEALTIDIDFEAGDAIAVDGERLSPAALLTRLNELGGAHGIGRVDLVENRFVGMKSRGIYETPGGTVLAAAHRGIESITLDSGAAHLKDELMPRYAELIAFAEQNQIPIATDSQGEAPFSLDANLLHISAEGKALEDPWEEAGEFVYSRTVRPEDAPDEPTYVEIDFVSGDPVALDGEALSPAALLTRLNEIAAANAVGRLDLVEGRFVGMKSRGIYETPGGTVLLAAHRGIESITLDRGAMHLKDELMPRYAELIYNGFWFSPERNMLQAAIDLSQEHVTGRVRLKLYKGSVAVVGRSSPKSLYSLEHVTFEADSVYDQRDAQGFIRLNALRLRLLHRQKG